MTVPGRIGVDLLASAPMGTVKHTFRHGVDAVFAKLTDPAHLEERSRAAGHKNVKASVEQKGDETVVRLERDIETEIPSFAKKIVSPVNHVVDTLRWRDSGDGGKRATYHVDVTNRISIDGEQSLRPSGDGCDFADTFHPKVDVPLVGKKIASLVDEKTEAGVREDCRRTEQALG